MKVACLRVSFNFLAWQINVFFFLQIFATWWICFQKMKKNSMIFRCVPHFAKVFNFKVCAKFQTIEIGLTNSFSKLGLGFRVYDFFTIFTNLTWTILSKFNRCLQPHKIWWENKRRETIGHSVTKRKSQYNTSTPLMNPLCQNVNDSSYIK